MENKQIRLQNLEILLQECKPSSYAEIERRTGVKANYLYQVTGNSEKPRNLGDQAARRLEIGMGKPVGWMDASHSESAEFQDLTDQEQVAALLDEFSRLTPEDAEVVRRVVSALNSSA